MSQTYKDVLTDDKSLSDFLRAMSDFDQQFCKAMVDGVDFTLRLEIHGASGKMIHARVNCDSFRRP